MAVPTPASCHIQSLRNRRISSIFLILLLHCIPQSSSQHQHQQQQHESSSGRLRHTTASDASTSTTTASSNVETSSSSVVPSLFESCLIPCYSDIVGRYGKGFADNLKNDGFVFENCADDNVNYYGENLGGEWNVERRINSHHHSHGHSHHGHSHEQHHDNINTSSSNSNYSNSYRNSNSNSTRTLGATNQPLRQWNIPSLRNPLTGHLEIPYAINAAISSSIFTPETHATILAALQHIEQRTGVIKFVERTIGQNEYIFFTYNTLYKNTCASNMGRQTDSKTSIYLGWCRFSSHRGSIVHELLHALGFWHEHSRPDRDDFISIRWDNVRADTKSFFQKALDVDSLGSPYDFNSIMHYRYNGFANDTNVATIVALEDNGKGMEKWEGMGQRVRLSDKDVGQLRVLYQCASGVRSTTNGGTDIGIEDLCSIDCKCWEYALGECNSDEECMGDLVCGDTPSNYAEIVNGMYMTDELPQHPLGYGKIECDLYCYVGCCDELRFPNNILSCPETCDSKPPIVVEDGAVLPNKMCLKAENGGTDRQLTTTTSTIATTTTTVVTTTTSNNAKWYIDWSIGKCVQDCIGTAPCGGKGQWVTFHNTVQQCCSAHLFWVAYDNCHTIPKAPLTNPPTRVPTRNPTGVPTVPLTASPTRMPLEPTLPPTKVPSVSPTSLPTNAPTTGVPTNSPTLPPTKVPTVSPTPLPTNVPTTGKPTNAPTPSPTPDPTTAKPTNAPTTGKPTNAPTPSPTPNPTTAQPINAVNDADWYVDWNRGGKCVQDCIGPAPCGGLRDPWENRYSTVIICCGTQWWKPFAECDFTPANPPPTKTPTSPPSKNPTNPPSPGPPTDSPTRGPTSKPTISAPTAKPTVSPTKKPTLLSSSVCSLLTQSVFEAVAPNAMAPYTYSGLCQAIAMYNNDNPGAGIFNQGTEITQRQELAAFLGNTLHESDEFRASREYLMCADNINVNGVTYCKPCGGDFNWDTKKCPNSLAANNQPINFYCEWNMSPSSDPNGCSCGNVYENPSYPGYVPANELFFGRGAIQLSWNYNYIDASVALTGSADTFCSQPDLIATNEEYAWGVGLYFWMVHLKDGKSSHDSIIDDQDFGGTLNNINGGLECPASGWGTAVKSRLNRYCRASTALGVSSLLSFDGCNGLQTSFQQCLGDGSCPDCLAWVNPTPVTKQPTSPPSRLPTMVPTSKPTTMPSKNPTTLPSPQPMTQPTQPPIVVNKATPSPSPPPTRSPTNNPTNKPTSMPTSKPTSSGNNLWYPDMETTSSKCLNDGNPPSWVTSSYTSQAVCCQAHFSWNYYGCTGTAPPSSNKWWIDWGKGKCVQDCDKSEGGSCGGLVAGSWITKHSSGELCCAAHLAYLPVSACKYTG